MMNLDKLKTQNLRAHLENKEKFLKLSHFFMRKGFKEIGKDFIENDFAELMKIILESCREDNIELVFKFSESPIETTFINSLYLCFIKNNIPLMITPPMNDTLSYIESFRVSLQRIDDLLAWYLNKYNDFSKIDEFLDNEVIIGKMAPEELPSIKYLIYQYKFLNLLNEYHLTLQAGFPNIKIEGKSIRVDMFFWIPAESNFNLIVECDGFEFHSDKDSFIKDRKRDRILKSKNFDVLRYSGSEIYNDPLGTASDLFDHLLERMPKRDEL
jgi:hypothetical protein